MLDVQLINLKQSEKENMTQNPELKKTISDSSKPVVFLRFLFHSQCGFI